MSQNSQALATPRKGTPPPASGSGSGPRPAEDILKAWQAPLNDRGEWFLCAEAVPNPNRYFDAFKALGGQVRQRKNGAGTDVWVMCPPGALRPHRKPSQAKPEAAVVRAA